MNDPDLVGKLVERVTAVAATQPDRISETTSPLPALLQAWESAQEAARAAAWCDVIPRRFTDAAVDQFSDPVRSELTGWAENHDGRNLVIFGPVGVGKTHAAVAAVRAAHHRGEAVAFWPVVELLDALRPSGPPDTFAALCHVDILILDDLGVERPTDWTDERLYALVNRRWLDAMPVVATTNLTPEQLTDTVGQRVFSRLVGSDAVCVRLTGPDRRRNQ